MVEKMCHGDATVVQPFGLLIAAGDQTIEGLLILNFRYHYTGQTDGADGVLGRSCAVAAPENSGPFCRTLAMHRRYEGLNIPIEAVRTFVVTAETGSFSKTGGKLGLSQPAISAQMKRFQNFLGGVAFEKVPGGVALTPLGKLALSHARRILEENDKILSIGGNAKDIAIRLGFSRVYAEEFFKIDTAKVRGEGLHLQCSNSAELAKAMVDGYLDIACLLNPTDDVGDLVADWQEEFVWVRNRNFTLSPGAPIPVVCWSEGLTDQPMIQALEKAGLTYRVVFASDDYHARLAAVSAGIGLASMPERYVENDMIIAKDFYLPPLAPMHAAIRVRRGMRSDKIDQAANILKLLAPDVKINIA
jgi:DNA-binding transcriptional LysR family regulator